MQKLSIGAVARAGAVGIETIRFYERQGLLKEPPRRPSGYREYDAEVIRRLRFIRRAKELGFTLKEIGELLDLRLDPSKTSADVKRRAQAKLVDIASKIKTLRRMHAALSKLAAACSGHGHTRDCPILDAIEREQAIPK